MDNSSNGLNNYAKIIHSQWGEDGIIEEIFKRIGTTNKFCVEFGAGEDISGSNVWHLIKTLGWKGLLIEGAADRYEKWKKPAAETKNLTILNTFVTIDGDSSIESLLSKHHAPKDLDLLSIDIDGDDYYIFNSLRKFTPRVLLVEHNPTIPPSDAIVQDPGEKDSFGASARAMVDLAHTKGYRLVGATQTNCIFVVESEFKKLDIQEPALESVFDWNGLSYIISSYNGSLYLKNATNPDSNPSYGWLYKGYNLIFRKKSFRAFTFGPTLNKAHPKQFVEAYQPIRVLRDYPESTGGLFHFIKNIHSFLKRK